MPVVMRGREPAGECSKTFRGARHFSDLRYLAGNPRATYNTKVRIIFAGTPETAVPSLRVLAQGHDVVAVLTRAPAKVGRKAVMQKSAVHTEAEHLGIPVLTPPTLRDLDVQHAIAQYEPDAVAVVAYGLLVPPSLLEVPRFGWLNLHFSLLPRWRGAAPVQYALRHGDDTTGITVFRIDSGLDTGPIAAQEEYPIPPRAKANEVLDELARRGAHLLSDVFTSLESGSVNFTGQRGQVSYAPQLTSAMAEIDWHESATSIANAVRGYTPEPGAWALLNGTRIKITDAKQIASYEAPDIPELAELIDANGAAPGQIVSTKKHAYVCTSQGILELITVWPAGKKPMRGADWARGLRSAEPPHFTPSAHRLHAESANTQVERNSDER